MSRRAGQRLQLAVWSGDTVESLCNVRSTFDQHVLQEIQQRKTLLVRCVYYEDCFPALHKTNRKESTTFFWQLFVFINCKMSSELINKLNDY